MLPTELLAAIPPENTLEHYLGGLPAAGDSPAFLRRAFHSGLIGCYVDCPDMPEWARKIARYSTDRLAASARHGWRAEDVIGADVRGKGKGQRAVHFQHAVNLDPRIFAGSQSYNNCTAWCTREIAGACIAVDIVESGELHAYEARPGTAGVYANRGTRQDAGEAISDGAEAVHQLGITLERDYPGVVDLSTQAADESAGVRWGGSGVRWGGSGIPSSLRELVKGDLIEQVSSVQEEEAVLDLLFAGHFVSTGSTRTAGGPGDPVSPLGSVGGHAQAMIGYDDTDEFRAWYAETAGARAAKWLGTDWVGIFDQSWGPGWLNVTNWPTQLWGPRPEGAFVLRGQDAMQLVTIWGEAIAMCKVAGFPMRKLPDWGSGQYL